MRNVEIAPSPHKCTSSELPPPPNVDMGNGLRGGSVLGEWHKWVHTKGVMRQHKVLEIAFERVQRRVLGKCLAVSQILEGSEKEGS